MNFILVVITGLLLAFSWPTFGFPFLLFFSFVPLLFVEDKISKISIKRTNLKIFFISYISFLIWNIIDTWWIYYSTLEGVILAVIFNSIFMSSFFTFYSFIKRKKGIRLGLIFFITVWISFEKLHHHWDFNWPWLSLGNAFSEYYKLIQWYEFTGILGGSTWVLVTNVLIFLILKNYRLYDKKLLRKKIILILSIIIIPCIFSIIIYNNYEINTEKTINSVVVQPNVEPHEEKFKMTNTEAFNQAKDIVNKIVDSNTQFIFFPETTLPSGINLELLEKNVIYNEIKQYLSSNQNLNIIIGATMMSFYKTKKTSTAIKNRDFFYDIYNSAIFINNKDSTLVYHKSKLVPGVEILPFAGIINYFLGNVIIDLGGISGSHRTQEERTVFKNSLNDIKVAPIICYESVYGEFVSKYVKNGANHLCIITNDGWWGNTQGHKQHFSFARLRAIECRKSISRSANTGISGFFNEKGDIVEYLGYEKKGALKMVMPINDKKTFYVLFGDYIAYISIIISFIIFISTFNKKIK